MKSIALSAWASAVVPGYDIGSRDPVNATRQTVADISDVLVPFGIKNQ